MNPLVWLLVFAGMMAGSAYGFLETVARPERYWFLWPYVWAAFYFVTMGMVGYQGWVLWREG